MFTRYLTMLSPTHWLKILLPLYVLGVVFFLRGFIADQMDMLFSDDMKKASEIFQVAISPENKSFAAALAKENDLKIDTSSDYTVFLKNNYMMKQRNEHQAVVAAAINKTQKKEKEMDEIVELPPKPDHLVSSVFVGKIMKFAVVNDKVYKIGDNLGSGEKVVAIEDGKIRINGTWGERWLFVNY
ncbi:MAG: hypothetical protein C0602_00720 [Denitrovibrio sp.]|nr:MAG: hypothetical protein C0602_00720 [Denitrovibrio sp.]